MFGIVNGDKNSVREVEKKSADFRTQDNAPGPDSDNRSVTPLMRPSPVNGGLAAVFPKPANGVSVPSSLISEGFEFEGNMKSAGALTVDGAIKGHLVVQTLMIGATGLVDGGVTADSINVEGCLSGEIECKDLVIGARAVVSGKLSYSTITIQKGGTIKGSIKRP